MEYIYLGIIITTHGLKGEMKLRSNFKYKDQAFIIGKHLYIGKQKEKHQILSYRKHQDYDMVILDGISDIDMAIKYKQELVYVLKDEIVLDNFDYFNEDLIGLTAFYNNEKIGVVKSISDQGNNNIVILLDTNIFIPKNKHFILKVDLIKKEIYFKNMEGLL